MKDPLDMSPEERARRRDRSRTVQAGVIGPLLIQGEELAGEIFSRVREEDFFDADLRHLFAAARALWLAQKPLDIVTIVHSAGADYESLAADIMRRTPTAANWEAYCDALREEADLARLQSVGAELFGAANAEEARALLQKAQGLLADRECGRIVSYREMLSDFFDRMSDETEAVFLDWGIPELNEHLHITQGRFVVLAAESSVGKTALALQLARGLAKGGKRVGFFSLETSAPDAADRLMANAGDVSLSQIKRRRLDAAALRRCMAEAEAGYELTLDLIEAAGCTVADIRALTLMRQYDVIFVDYVQIVASDRDEPAEQVRAISMGLHTLALQLGCTVIGLSQVTPPPKNNMGLRPELCKDNLRESRQLIHDAEAILILDLADLRDYGSNRIFKVDKNKDGPCLRMTLSFDAARMRFAYAPSYEDPDTAAAWERNATMDRNRKTRREKDARKRGIEGQATFKELSEEESGPLPF